MGEGGQPRTYVYLQEGTLQENLQRQLFKGKKSKMQIDPLVFEIYIELV